MTDQIDMSHFVEAKSDQLNSDDLIGVPRTITISRVDRCEGDQPIALHYEGDGGKPFKPCLTIRRVLLGIWGRYAADYVGRSMTIYRDDRVTYGALEVGGIRISHMSHLDKETVVVVAKSKGKKVGIKIAPLKIAAAPDRAAKWAADYIAAVTGAADLDALEALASSKAAKLAELADKRADLHEQCVAAYQARFDDLTPADADPDAPPAELPDGF